VSEAALRINASTEHVRALRTRLEPLPPVLVELELRAASTANELAQARTQANVDREAIQRLESELAERESQRSSLRDRLQELERRVATAASELTQARAQAHADREAVQRLEAELADREAVRSLMRDRLAELGRMLGPT
jgi:chromosome segregation ATPase